MCCSHLKVGLWILCLSYLTLSGGCSGDSRASVTGKVTLDGQPIENGVIIFVPEDKTKGQSAGASIERGSYEVQGANLPPAGIYTVTITALIKTGKKVPAGSPLPPGTMVDETVEGIPAKYNKNSSLHQELKSGRNVCDFALIGK